MWRRETREKHPVRAWAEDAYHNAKRRAQKGGVAFTLTIKLLMAAAPTACPVLGVPLNYAFGRARVGPCSPSVDRVDPTGGYTPENILIVSHRANTIKSNACPREILAVGQFYANLEGGPLAPAKQARELPRDPPPELPGG